MSVADHVDEAALLSSECDDFDARNSRLVDGRAIHHYLQFIEPWQLSIRPDAAHELPAGRTDPLGSVSEGGLSPMRIARTWLREHERITFPATRSSATLWIDEVIPIEVFERSSDDELREAGDDAVGQLGMALGRLSEVGLAFFVELAIGAVIVERRSGGTLEQAHARPAIGLLNADADVAVTAEWLLAQAAAQFMWLWIEVEEHLGGPGRDPRGVPELRELTSRFADAVVIEYQRRTEPADPASAAETRARLCALTPGLLAWLDGFRSTPLSQELFSCWHPGWRRSLFIFNSPFDHITRLERREHLGGPNDAPG